MKKNIMILDFEASGNVLLTNTELTVEEVKERMTIEWQSHEGVFEIEEKDFANYSYDLIVATEETDNETKQFLKDCE